MPRCAHVGISLLSGIGLWMLCWHAYLRCASHIRILPHPLASQLAPGVAGCLALQIAEGPALLSREAGGRSRGASVPAAQTGVGVVGASAACAASASSGE